jgi:hypothetical protein
MAINYPTSLDTFTNPTATDLLTSPSHAQQHADINDAVEAVQTKLAIGNTVIGTYTAYTPTWTNLTVGNGVVSSAYCRVNDFVHFYGKFTFGSTSAISGTVLANFPVNVNSAFMNDASIYGVAQYRDISTSTLYPGLATFAGNNTLFTLRVQIASGTYLTQTGVTGSAPFTWATGDFMAWNLYYRAA